jgi:hypothetical protein
VAALRVGGKGGVGEQGRAMVRLGGAGSRAMVTSGGAGSRAMARSGGGVGGSRVRAVAYRIRTLVARQRRRKVVLYKLNNFFGLKMPRIQATDALTGGCQMQHRSNRCSTESTISPKT